MSPAIRPAPTVQGMQVSEHAVAQYQERVKPALDTVAARAELERLIQVAQVLPATNAPRWVHDADRATVYYLLLGDAIALPLRPQGHGWVASTCLAAGTYTPVRRAQRSAYKASRATAKRAKRRTRY